MYKLMGLGAMGILGLIGCASNSGTATTNYDPVAVRSAPAGMSTLGFLDLEGSVRPDGLPGVTTLPSENGPAYGLSEAATALPACAKSVTVGSTTTFTFTQCKAASTGTLSGTIAVTAAAPSGGSTVYTEVINLTSALDATRSWHYTGTKTVTVIGSTALVSVPATAPIQAVYTDSAVPANNKTYAYTTSLAVNWATAGRFLLSGSFSFARANADAITATISSTDPVLWNSTCDYPVSGTLALALTGPSGSATTSAVFGPACGQVSLGGGTLALGSH